MKIKNKKLFKNKLHMIVYIISCILILIAFVYIGNINYYMDEADNIKFNVQYPSVSKENIYVYSDARDILKALEGDSVILFGSPQSDWTESLALYTNDIAIENKIEEILYYDFYDDRTINNGNYELIVQRISNYLYTDDTGRQDINAPLLLIVKNGKVIYTFDDTVFNKGNIEPEDYWNYTNIGFFENNFESALKYYMEIG